MVVLNKKLKSTSNFPKTLTKIQQKLILLDYDLVVYGEDNKAVIGFKNKIIFLGLPADGCNEHQLIDIRLSPDDIVNIIKSYISE